VLIQRVRLEDFFSRLDELERLLALLLPRARSLCASLFWLLARAPRLPASERLMVPPERELPEREEEEEERDAIENSLVGVVSTLGVTPGDAIGIALRLA
jgi:hypothetical protein